MNGIMYNNIIIKSENYKIIKIRRQIKKTTVHLQP